MLMRRINAMRTRRHDWIERWSSALLISLVIAGSVAAQVPQKQTKSENQSDTKSIDSMLGAFYQSLSFPQGGLPDWTRFRSLFASATSPCVRIAGDSVMQMDREGFIAFFGGRIQRGTLKSFAEKEISRSGNYYGSLAQVFSTYEKRMNLADDGKPVRGINSFQMYVKDGRWWIASVTWQDESPAIPIPSEYLR
jgi:hypothetical protein